ncbi:MAG: hypothetical protein ABWY37_06040 [Microbacterium pygmaeum]
MSTSEPFLPIEKPTNESPAEEFEEFELDVDDEPDILPGAGDDDEVAPEFPANGVFQPPVPGERITEEQLESDLDE